MFGIFEWALYTYTMFNAASPRLAEILKNHSNQITFGVAIMLVITKIVLRFIFRRRPYANPELCIDDFLNGCLIVPFGSICLSVFSQDFLKRTDDGIFTISAAGAIGMFFVLGKLSKLG